MDGACRLIADRLPSPQLRLDHRPDGTYTVRADQAEAEALFADQGVLRHLVVSHFTWRLPEMKTPSRTRRLAGLIVNRWLTSLDI